VDKGNEEDRQGREGLIREEERDKKGRGFEGIWITMF